MDILELYIVFRPELVKVLVFYLPVASHVACPGAASFNCSFARGRYKCPDSMLPDCKFGKACMAEYPLQLL